MPHTLDITQLRDTLYNLHQNSGASDEYRKGVLVGVVGALMACGYTWRAAINTVAANLPDTGAILTPERTVPPSWFDTLCTEAGKHGKKYVCYASTRRDV